MSCSWVGGGGGEEEEGAEDIGERKEEVEGWERVGKKMGVEGEGGIEADESSFLSLFLPSNPFFFARLINQQVQVSKVSSRSLPT